MRLPQTASHGRLAAMRSVRAAAVPITVCMALASLLMLLLAGSASAEFTPASLASGTATLQFESAEAPALAREGGYLAFQGKLAGVSGVWRRNLQTGAIEPVATAYAGEDPGLGAPTPALSASDAAAPSISADGRYVAFTTTSDLEPERINSAGEPEGEPASDEGCPEVYVRDMDLPANAEGAYTLASALGKSGAGILFAGECPSKGGEFALAGAQAAPGVALSANGRSVAFTVLSQSNLARGATCAPATPAAECAPETPASQVAVRNLESDITTLVSVTPEGQPVPGGGAFPSTASQRISGLRIGSNEMGSEITGSTAAISGNGSTIAWLGTDVPEQVPGSAAEIDSDTNHIEGEDPAPYEAEPLWRRIEGNEGSFTRRLLAGAGLDFFFNRGETNTEFVRGGSFVATGSAPVFLPLALSEDGDTAAFVANAPHPAALVSLERSGQFPPQTDAYAVRVSDDPALAPQVIPLTETPDYDVPAGGGSYGFISDVSVSPDGDRIAFDSERTQMTLPTLALISPPAATSQTYEANLELGTLQRVITTYDGAEPSGAAPGLLSFSEKDGVLAFTSGATNLFYGDAVIAPEVYLAQEIPYNAQPAPEHLETAPNEPLPQQEWKLNATASAQADGSVVVHARVPGAGSLAVQASAQLPASATRARGKRAKRAGSGAKRQASRHAHSASNDARPQRVKGRAKPASGRRLVTRTVAKASMVAGAPVLLALRLRAGTAYRADVTAKQGLYAVLRVSFQARGHKTLTAEIPVTFHDTKHRKASKGKPQKVKHTTKSEARR